MADAQAEAVNALKEKLKESNQDWWYARKEDDNLQGIPAPSTIERRAIIDRVINLILTAAEGEELGSALVRTASWNKSMYYVVALTDTSVLVTDSFQLDALHPPRVEVIPRTSITKFALTEEFLDQPGMYPQSSRGRLGFKAEYEGGT
ncbi:MAG: hypothetical protein JWM61_2765, partial [Micrococcaceae bacterium]|nr:hypothetical protein [Micrococcaceae bacterium]